MKVTTIGIDTGKRTFHLLAQEVSGRECWRRKVKRGELLRTLSQLSACTVVMESSSGAQHWAREMMKLGHRVRLLARSIPVPTSKATRTTSTTRKRFWKRTPERAPAASP